MVTQRVVACLDVRDDRVVKGTGFRGLRDVGDPSELAHRYELEGADEIVYLDISATIDKRATMLDLARRTAERLFIPLTIGGGIRSAEDVAFALRAGADKVCLNSAIVARPQTLTEAARRFGSQCVVASIDAMRDGDRWRVHTHGGRAATALDAVQWAVECVDRGAGEILITSIDRDGTRSGYDIELTCAIASRVPVPVIASGGAGSADHIVEAFLYGGASAALVAGLLHDGVTTVRAIKAAMAQASLPVRMVAHE